MSDLNRVVLCLEKIRSKNLGQNPDNLKQFLMKDFNYVCEEAMKLIDEAINTNIIKSITFNGKVAYRIIKSDSIVEDTVIIPETEEVGSQTEQVDETVVMEDTQSNRYDQQSNTNVLHITEKLQSSFEAVEKRFVKIEDHLIGLSYPTSANPSTDPGNLTQIFFYTNLLKNRISELEKQIADKNTIIDFLSTQITSKPPVSQSNYRNDFNKEDKHKSNSIETPLEKSKERETKDVIVIGDSMLNNINSRGLSKSKKVEVLNFSGATSVDIVDKMDVILDDKPKSIIVHVGTNDLTNDVNLLNNVKKIKIILKQLGDFFFKTKKKSPNTKLCFSDIIIRTDKKNLEKPCVDTNARLKNFCKQKNLDLIVNNNLKENHLAKKKLHLNRKGDSIFAKNLIDFIEGNGNFDSDGELFQMEEDVSDDSTILHSDVKKSLKNIRNTNINKLIFGHLNINSLRNKFDLLSEQVKGSIDIFMVSETKLDDSFPEGQFLIEGFHSPFRFDRNRNGGGILLYVREDIPAKLLSHDFPSAESFFIDINLHKKKWLINCTYNPHKSNIGKHLDVISRSLDTFSTKYENIILLGDFNACVGDEALQSFCKSYSLHSLIKQPTCFKNPDNPSCIDLFLTNKPRSFQTKCIIETGLSDFHRMTISVLKMHFRKLPPKVINYRNFKKIDNERFMNSLHYTLSEEQFDYSKNPDKFFETCQTVLIKHAPRKKKYVRGNNKPFMTKAYSKAIMHRTRLRNKFLKNPTDSNKVLYNRQRNYCVSLLRKEKKEYFANLNEKTITDNRKFWHTVKPFLSDKVKSKEAIILVNKDNIESKESEV